MNDFTIIRNEPPDVPLELIFEISSWLLSEQKAPLSKTSLNTTDDKMLYLLWAKFEKYAYYTVGDALAMNVKEEFYSMFTKERLAELLFNNDWNHDPR